MPRKPPKKIAQEEFLQLHQPSPATLYAELSAGLLAAHAYTHPKYFYNALGSKLFAAICELPEYYPTRTEAEIFNTHANEITQAMGVGCTLIDLGAGNCAKAAQLFAGLQPSQYVPIDISVEFLRESVSHLQQYYPQIKMTGIGLDFSTSLQLSDAVHPDKRVFFYPGSSVGNFTPEEAVVFFNRLHAACNTDGSLLIGVDLIKDKTFLDAAYDDALGVTAAFNLNVLLHLNTLLGANFKVRDWQHRGFYNIEKSRIEMHLEARHALTVTWKTNSGENSERRFLQGERIHTENSYKYTQAGFEQLLQQAKFEPTKIWKDSNNWFMLCYARPQSNNNGPTLESSIAAK